MNKQQYMQKKIINIQNELKYNEKLSVLDKVDLEITMYELLMRDSIDKKDIDNSIVYKKKKLEKEIEYIKLIESQKNVKFTTLKNFLKRDRKDFEYVRTYIRAIDEYLKPDDSTAVGGIPVGVMVQFAARSGAGKTTTLMRLMLNIAKSEKIAHFNYEMSEPILHRTYAKLIENFVGEKELENLIIVEEPDSQLEKLINYIKLLNYRENIRFFVIDSRMKIKTNDWNSKEAASNISRQLSSLVRELGITIILINQLSEEAIKENRIVLKESGDQYYDADLIFGLGFLYKRDEANKIIKDDMNQPIVLEDVRKFICEKNRLGKPYKTEIYYHEVFPKNIKEITLTQDDFEDGNIVKSDNENTIEEFNFDDIEKIL